MCLSFTSEAAFDKIDAGLQQVHPAARIMTISIQTL